MSDRYRVVCKECSLSHVWPTESEARRERNNHHLHTGHDVNVEYETVKGVFQ